MDKTTKDATKSVSPQARRKFLQVLDEMREEVDGGRSAIKTCADYHPGRHMSNAEVFIELSDWRLVGMWDDGILCEKESAGVMPFQTLVNMLMKTDRLHRLSRTDAEEAIAMVYHLTPQLHVVEYD